LAERSPRLEALRAWSLLRSGDAAAGLAAAAEASRRQPDDPYVSQVWAAAQLANGQAQLARDLLAVLAARGGGWSTWHDLGLAQLALADPQAALSSFEQAAARCPGCEPAVKNRNALRRILGAL
jgi:Flp pilus assembly protein TadD